MFILLTGLHQLSFCLSELTCINKYFSFTRKGKLVLINRVKVKKSCYRPGVTQRVPGS